MQASVADANRLSMQCRSASKSVASIRPVPGTLLRRRVIGLAQKQEDKPPEPATQKVDKVIEELKSAGMTAAKAKEVLKAWQEVGVTEGEDLRKLLVTRNLAPVPGLALQALFDGTAAFGGFYFANLVSTGDDFPFKILVEILGNFFGCYYFVQVLLEAVVMFTLLWSTYKYGSSSSALLAAVQNMAGPITGVSVVDKAQTAVNVLKVTSTLEQVSAMLKDEFSKDQPKNDSLRNLGAYLTLAQAREKLGFTPEKYGLSEKEASRVAYAFSTYDTNDDFNLDANELRKLCENLGQKLDEAEAKEAVKLLDVSNAGSINFIEFVAWWVAQCELKSKAPPS